MDMRMSFTRHAMIRMRQRGCDADIIQAAIDHGRMILKQGYEFYCVAGKDLPVRMPHAQADRLKNLVVVCREGVVVTAYRNGNGFRNVKKKGKRLRNLNHSTNI